MNNIVALKFDSSKARDVEIELDADTLLNVGSRAREPTLHLEALERLAMSQTLDDLQNLVWP